jgi:DNA-binding transcriptional MerR regulator
MVVFSRVVAPRIRSKKMTELFSSITEVSKQLDLPSHTLRYWEKEFPGVIKPITGAGGRRHYRSETVAAIAKLKDLLHVRGMTLIGVKKMIASGEFQEEFRVQSLQPEALAKGGAEFRVNNVESIANTSENLLDNLKNPLASGTNPKDIEKIIDILKQAKAVL